MRLTTEELPEIDEVTPAEIEQILTDDVFGKFVVLGDDEAFIQAACVWEPGTECSRFIQETGSDPFCLEYRDGKTGQLFGAEEHVTLEQVKLAFLEYLGGRMDWLTRFVWAKVEY
ncbi:MAG: hypothetical protein U0792_11560 [Gemmataceae bacterium]